MEPYTIDASIFVNAFNPYEVGHETSHQFMQWIYRSQQSVIVPTLLLPELGSAIGRGRGDAQLAREFVARIHDLAHFFFAELTDELALLSASVAATYRLRGSDAVYVAVAQRFGATLITLDREQRQRVASAIPARSPGEMVAKLGLDGA
jgi:predicted nucleic acid-binding protein